MSTSKTIAALLGPTLVATALMVLVNLDAMPTIIEELSNSPMLIVLAGYAAFVPGLAIRLFPQSMDWPLAGANHVGRMVVAAHRSHPNGLSDAIGQGHGEGCSNRDRRAADGRDRLLLIGGSLTFKAYSRD